MAKRDIRKVMIVSLAGYSCLGANNITCDFFGQNVSDFLVVLCFFFKTIGLFSIFIIKFLFCSFDLVCLPSGSIL